MPISEFTAPFQYFVPTNQNSVYDNSFDSYDEKFTVLLNCSLLDMEILQIEFYAKEI